MADTLTDICSRLAAGSQGRTEADIQSDIRKFILDAPLELDGQDLLDVQLEAQVGAGRRIDIEAGTTVIEVKKSLDSPNLREEAREQLAGYVRQRSEETQQRFVGVLTDGRAWLLHHLVLGGELKEVDSFRLSGPGDASALSAWLEAVMATTSQLPPNPQRILRFLGEGSPSFALDRADLQDLYEALRAEPEVQLKRELWGRLLTAALGTNFQDSDELFVEHTYLVLTAELIAHSVAGVPIDLPGSDVKGLLEGRQFVDAGIRGVVEADFFDWPALLPSGELLVRAIARRLNKFDWSKVEHDILKVIYESVIDTETRHELGEYYTPDWLAQKMVDEHVSAPLDDKVLDPSCGSGTFLFWAVRRCLNAADHVGMTNREAVELVVNRVAGIDLHPVAVTLARVTYLLAIGRDRLADRGELTIPVYLGDSVRWDQDASLLQQGGITVHTSDGMELFDQELHFPEGVLGDPLRFDRLVSALAGRAADPDRDPVEAKRRKDGQASAKSPKAPDISEVLSSFDVAESDRAAVQLVFEKLCRLHDAGRDHIWGYYIRNLARPLSFTRAGAQADVLVGNPPWLAYRHMPVELKQSYERLAKSRGLWSGGKNATHQDLSDLFVVRAAEQYLRPSGRFAFVMPFAVLSRRQYEGFRYGVFASQGGGETSLEFDIPEDFSEVKPAFFPVPGCVVAGTKGEASRALPTETLEWRGRVEDSHLGWDAASQTLKSTPSVIQRVGDTSAASPYRASFQQGATLVPRVLIAVTREDAGPLGISAGRTRIRSARSSLEKSPWKGLSDLTGAVEDDFLRPMVTGASIVAFRARQTELTAVPAVSGALLNGSDPTLDRTPGMAQWWRKAEATWAANRPERSKMTLLERIDYHRGLSRQLKPSEHRVVYTTSGQYLAACRISNSNAVVDSSLYWASCDSEAEAKYLIGFLNSDELLQRVRPLQSRGEHNPRHFHLLPFELAIPAYVPENETHVALIDAATRAESRIAEVDFPVGKRFEAARRHVRETLVESGIGAALDDAVKAVLG